MQRVATAFYYSAEGLAIFQSHPNSLKIYLSYTHKLSMAKIQELTDLFCKYSDGEGEISHLQFSELMSELGLPSQYPGSISKMFRKLNYSNPGKTTINLHQTIEYYSSFQTPSKHDIWKAKYSCLEHVHEARKNLMSGALSAAPAAPGAQPQGQHYEDSQQDAKVNILIGQPKPIYLSEIEIEVEKSEKNSKVKPFVKLVLTSSTPERAKKVQTVFKENFTAFLTLLAEDISDWTEEMKNFHVNSMVQGTNTTFFFTTANEELISLIQIFSQQFELVFNAHLECKIHLKFEFQYDFQDFLKKASSNFYDIFVKQSRLSLTGKTFRLIKQLKEYLKIVESSMFPVNIIQKFIPLGLLHLEEFGVDLEFDSFGNDQEYQLESKNEIYLILAELAGFLMSLTQGGMAVRSLLQLLDGSIYIEADVGHWRFKNYFRLTNINKVFLNFLDKSQNPDSPYIGEEQQTHLGAKQGPKIDDDMLSCGSVGSTKKKTGQLFKKNSNQSLSDEQSEHSKQQQTEQAAKKAPSPKLESKEQQE